MKKEPLKNVSLRHSGMNNKAAPHALPKDKLRNAVNVIFDDDDNIIFPRPGKTLRYAGDCHSIYNDPSLTLFVENGSLKVLNANNTATTIKTGLGNNKTHYASVGDTVYFANGVLTGKVRNLTASEWGVARPPRQPDCHPIATGDMHAGDYRVALTWIADDESGTGMGKRVTVAEGGGIRVANFPIAPSYVTHFALYVSSVNGKDMYLYGEYPIGVSEVYINRLTEEGVLPTVPLTTQFGFVPRPQGKIVLHLGRIYYPRGSKIYWTQPHRYGLQFTNSYWAFDSDIQVVVSTPPSLYVGTQKRIYKIVNIDSEDGTPPHLQELRDCASVAGSESTDATSTAYWMSDRGFISATEEGITELTYEQVAIPAFESGTTTVTEINGVAYLVGAFQNGVQNPLANTDVNVSELARGSL